MTAHRTHQVPFSTPCSLGGASWLFSHTLWFLFDSTKSLLCSSFPDSSNPEEEKWQLYFHFLTVILKLLSYVHLHFNVTRDLFCLPRSYIQKYSYFSPFFLTWAGSSHLVQWLALWPAHLSLLLLKNGVPLFLLNSKCITKISDVLLFVGAINTRNAALKRLSHLRRKHLESGCVAYLLWPAALVRFFHTLWL